MTPQSPRSSRIVLIDDHVLFRSGLRHLLENEEDMDIVGEASTFSDAVALCISDTQFDLALIDYQMDSDDSNASGVEISRLLQENKPSTKIIMLTGGLPSATLVKLVKQHRVGIFFKNEPASELLDAVRRTLRGDVAISSEATRLLVQLASKNEASISPATFNSRELLVLRLITEGLANKEIASRLETTETNVKAILQKLFEKTGVRSRSQLVRYVFEFDLELP